MGFSHAPLVRFSAPIPMPKSGLGNFQSKYVVWRISLVHILVEGRHQMELRRRKEKISVAADCNGIGPQELRRPREDLELAVGSQHLDCAILEGGHVEVALCVKLETVCRLRHRHALNALAQCRL